MAEMGDDFNCHFEVRDYSDGTYQSDEMNTAWEQGYRVVSITPHRLDDDFVSAEYVQRVVYERLVDRVCGKRKAVRRKKKRLDSH